MRAKFGASRGPAPFLAAIPLCASSTSSRGSMVSRGSSIHHTRRTSNPFMTTSSGIVGINLKEPAVFDAPKFGGDGSQTQQAQQTTASLKDFMYQTTSHGLGDGVRVQRSTLSQRMDKQSLHKEVSESGLVKVNPVEVVAPQECMLSPEALIPASLDTKPISDARPEHPMYATSYRDIGVEKSHLKVEVERLGRPNTFTNSFNGFRYRDFGLNTAITKSRICDQLEYS